MPPSVEANVASVDYLGDRLHLRRLPRFDGFPIRVRNVLPLCDAAIVVCEADERKLPALRLILRELEDLGVPRILFLNKIDQATARIRKSLALLQPASRTPLLLRQIPIWQNGIATGFIDLALERAFVYREHAPSKWSTCPPATCPTEKEARYSMLEHLADYDDALMEELISDIEPPRDQVFDDLAQDLRVGPGGAAADRRGRSRQRRDAAAEGAAARGARHRADPRAPRRRRRRSGARPMR